MHEAIVFDVARESGTGGLMLLGSFGLVCLFIAGGVVLAGRDAAPEKARANPAAFAGAFFFAVIVYFMVQGWTDRSACIAAERAGEFETTAGLVSGLTQIGSKPPYGYSFTVGGHEFVIGSAIVGDCGLAPSPSSRFKFHDGQSLRIDHQGNRIFRVVLLTPAA